MRSFCQEENDFFAAYGKLLLLDEGVLFDFEKVQEAGVPAANAHLKRTLFIRGVDGRLILLDLSGTKCYNYSEMPECIFCKRLRNTKSGHNGPQSMEENDDT